MHVRQRLFEGCAIAGLALCATACSRHEDTGSSTGSSPSIAAQQAPASDVGASGVAAPYVAIVPADAQPPGNGSASGKPAGAETSPSTAAGPGNGSTAVGGQAGGQATGSAAGGAPQKSAGDGR